MREFDDPRWQPLGMAIELADFNLRADPGVKCIDPGQCNGLAQNGRAHAAGNGADLGAANMHAIAVADRVIGIDLETDELAARVFLARDQRLLADEVVRLRLQWHREANASFERIGLRCEFIIGKDQARFDAHHVEGFETHRLDAMFLSSLPHRVEHRSGILGVAEDFISQLAGVASARHDERRTFEVTNAADGKAEPLKLADCRLCGRRPDDLLHQLAAVGALYRNVVQLIRG